MTEVPIKEGVCIEKRRRVWIEPLKILTLKIGWRKRSQRRTRRTNRNRGGRARRWWFHRSQERRELWKGAEGSYTDSNVREGCVYSHLQTSSLDTSCVYYNSTQPWYYLPSFRREVWSLGREVALEEGMATSLVFLPGESHGQRSLVGYSP